MNALEELMFDKISASLLKLGSESNRSSQKFRLDSVL
jgi:hypothetical protein